MGSLKIRRGIDAMVKVPQLLKLHRIVFQLETIFALKGIRGKDHAAKGCCQQDNFVGNFHAYEHSGIPWVLRLEK